MVQLPEAVSAVVDKLGRYEEALAYYDGEVKEVFGSLEIARLLRRTSDVGNLNYARVVVDAVFNRIEIANVRGSSERATNRLADIWENNDLAVEAREIHRNTLVFGDAYAVVWPNENGDTEIVYNSPMVMSMVYEAGTVRQKKYAVKLWKDSDEVFRMNIYTKDSLVKYLARTQAVIPGTEWEVTDSVPNPFGEIPVFHFRTDGQFGRPEHKDAYGAQDSIHKHFVRSLIIADYQSAPQRWALTKNSEGTDVGDFEEGDTARENIDALSNKPGNVWFLRNVDAVGEFKPANPDVFWSPIQNSVKAMAGLTQTPMSYFDKMANQSGEAGRAAEAPLIKKIKDREASFTSTWKELLRFVLKVDGVNSKVEVRWTNPESLDNLDFWDVQLKKINAGLSHRQALREAGYEEDEIDRIMAEREQEAANGLYYQRAPQTRVNTNNDETQAIQSENN